MKKKLREKLLNAKAELWTLVKFQNQEVFNQVNVTRIADLALMVLEALQQDDENKEVRIHNEPDRSVTIFVGKKQIASTNYDESGWSGMETLEYGAEQLAKALGAKVKKTEGELEDDEEESEDDETTDAE